MEYEILNIPEGSSTDVAKQALNKVRKACHPDKHVNVTRTQSDICLKLLHLSERAYERIKDKNKVHASLSPLFTFPRMPNVPKSITPEHVFTSSYSFQNVNGQVTESGTVNGRVMTQEELQKRRFQLRS
jgi:preprotein translocase subunit Sec63